MVLRLRTEIFGLTLRRSQMMKRTEVMLAFQVSVAGVLLPAFRLQVPQMRWQRCYGRWGNHWIC